MIIALQKNRNGYTSADRDGSESETCVKVDPYLSRDYSSSEESKRLYFGRRETEVKCSSCYGPTLTFPPYVLPGRGIVIALPHA